MLLNLDIKNAAIIEHVSIDVGDGFTVLTGETGAGKSVIIGTLNLLMGARGNKDLVRFGEKKAVLQAIFYTNDKSILKKHDLDADEENIIISREIFADGKSVCRINGSFVPQSVVKEVTEHLINIHGQHDSQALLNQASHIDFLDSFSKNEELLAQYKEVYQKKNSVEKAILSLKMDEEERERKIEFLSYQIDEIKNASIVAGEKAELLERREIVRNGERIQKALSDAYDELYNGEKSAYELVSQGANAISKIASFDARFEGFFEKINDIMYGIEDISHDVYNTLSGIEYDEETLNKIEERLDLITRLERKHGGSEEKILEFLKDAEEELSKITNSDEEAKKLSKELSELEKTLEKMSEEISKIRRENAKILSGLIKKELSELDMTSAEFEVEITPLDAFSSKGGDRVEFLISTNKGEPKKPLEKIASGGELSRIMLGIKGILADSDNVDTLIFDEIDTGVSGSAAKKIARKLKSLASKKQIICISHQPTIAAAGDNHFVIKKTETDSRVTTSATLLEGQERIEEIARITDGENITDTAKAHAKELLDAF